MEVDRMKFSNEGESNGGFCFSSHEIPGKGIEWFAECLFNAAYRQLPEECKKVWRERAIQWLTGLNEASFSHLELPMHYRNGREAKNGDKIIMLSGYGAGAQIAAVGLLYDAKPGNDYCNGAIAPIQGPVTGACLCDCLHLDDVEALLKEKGLDKRPAGK